MVRLILLVVAAAILGGASGARAAEEDPQCMDNGKCCAELNQFWDRVAARADPASKLSDDVLRGDKDFLMLDSTKYKWDRKLVCPSKQSKIAEAFRIIFELSQTEYATIDYYDFVKRAIFDRKIGFALLDIDDAFAQYNAGFYLISISSKHMSLHSSVKLASIIIHEGAHVYLMKEGEHVICDHGQRKGADECDQKLANDFASGGGVRTWQAFFLHDYIKSSSNEKMKKSATGGLHTIIHDMVNSHPKYGPDGVTPLKKYYGVDKLP